MALALRSRCGVLLACGLMSLACGSSAPVTRPKSDAPIPTPARVTPATYAGAVRSYRRLAVRDSRLRRELARRLTTYLAARNQEVLDAGDYKGVVEHVVALTSLSTPEELSRGQLPDALLPLADYLIAKGSPRGDEARVLSGLLIKRLLMPHADRLAADYDRRARWTREVRRAISGPLERFDGLVEAWEEHARIIPTHDTLRTLAQLYIERRDAIEELSQSPEGQRSLLAQQGLRSVVSRIQRAGMNAAAVYLRHGNTAAALRVVEGMSASSAVESPLVRLLRQTRSGGQERFGALLEMAEAYLGVGRLGVSAGLCWTGLREARSDSRFALCLARVASAKKDYAGATAWYSEAIEHAPHARGLYDEALQVLSHLINDRLFDTDQTSTRRLARHAGKILEQRVRRWPDSPPPVQPEQLYLALGMAEMNGGNARAAARWLQASVKERATADALKELGLLAARTGRPVAAVAFFERALKLVEAIAPASRGEREQQRAQTIEHLADALRAQGKNEQASASYMQALKLWLQLAPRLHGPALARSHVRRGVLLSHLNRRQGSRQAFAQALRAGPTNQGVYSAILSHLVVAQADADFAQSVFRRALRKLMLEPEWKVYFALWTNTIAARSHVSPDPEVTDTLRDLCEGSDWSAKLASFALEKLEYHELLASASGVGQRTEAHFYEAARRLANGDVQGAAALFKVVLDGHMVNFFEHGMALELLQQRDAADSPTTAYMDGNPSRPASMVPLQK